MRVLLLNNLPAPYFLPVFRHLAIMSGWELLICFATRWRPDLGWSEGSVEATIPARTVYLEGPEAPAGKDRDESGNAASQFRRLLASWRKAGWNKIGALLGLLWRERPEYLVCYGYTQTPQLTLLLWALLFGVPFALIGDANIHCDRARGVRRILKRLWLRLLTAKAAAILTIGTANRQFWKKYGASDERMFHVPFAVDNQKFSDVGAEKGAAPSGLKGRVRFISVGRLIERKNVGLLIEAMQQLGPTEAAGLMIAGDGEQRAQLVAAAGEDQRIVFLGNVRPDDLPQCYNMADVMILAARDEPWGLVTNEAMASGLAVIAHAECGSAVDLVSSENGIILQSFAVAEIVAAMRRLIGNPTELEEMKRNSRKKIVAWSVEAAATSLIAAVEQTIRR